MCDPFSLIPRGSDMQEHGERGSERVLPVFSHSSLQIPLWTPWALTVTLFYPPWIINPFFFWGALNGHKSSGLSFHIGKWKASDLWAFTLHVTHLMTKLHLTSAFGKTYQNSPACSIGVGKLKERKKKSSFAYSVNSLICFLSWHFKPSSVSACKLIFGSGSSLKSYNEHMSVCQTSKHACASVGIQKEQSSRPWK